MPDAPVQRDADNAGQDAPAIRQTAAIIVMQVAGLQRLFLAPAGNLRLEAVHQHIDVQAEIAGIGADETDGVGPARQIVQPVILHGVEMVLADLQRARHGSKVVATPDAGGAQVLTDGFQGIVAIAGNFAKVDAAAAAAVILIGRHLGKLRHVCVAGSAKLR